MIETKDYQETLATFAKRLTTLDNSAQKSPSWKLFGILLAAPPAVISCAELTQLSLQTASDPAIAMGHFCITDQTTLLEEVGRLLHRGSHWQYEQFLTFWQGRPEFDLGRMNAQGKQAFEEDMDFASIFYPILAEKGFAAWDIGESIHIVRGGYDCGFIDETFADKLINDLTDSALEHYDNWSDYSLSYLCGGCYYTYADSNKDKQVARRMFQQMLGAMEQLFFDDQINLWQQYQWKKTEK